VDSTLEAENRHDVQTLPMEPPVADGEQATQLTQNDPSI